MTVKCHFSIINAAVQCHILRMFEEKEYFRNSMYIKVMNNSYTSSEYVFA
jgi:hypothetical protein